MPELKIHVPTYNASAFEEAVRLNEKPEFGDPYVPVVAREADGVRIVLGSHDFWDATKPDIQIERRPNGWAVFLHPMGGGDASGFVYMIDDGRSFVARETGTTPPIEMLDYEHAAALVDGTEPSDDPPPRAHEMERECCELCGNNLDIGGDNWDGLCPECADQVSGYIDANNWTEEDRDKAIDQIRLQRSAPQFSISQEGYGSPRAFEAVLRQSRRMGCYSAVSLCLTRALLQQWADSPRGVDVPSLHPIAQDGRDFPVGDSCFHVLARINDRTLRVFQRLAEEYEWATVLCPPRCKQMLTKVAAAEKRWRGLLIQGIDEYARLRISFTSMDTGRRSPEIVRDLIDRYNALAKESGQSKLMIHVIQSASTASPSPSR